MSDTHHLKNYTKHRISGRANPYGLCVCASCRAGRRTSRALEKIKHRFRTAWKTGRKLLKGGYTD